MTKPEIYIYDATDSPSRDDRCGKCSAHSVAGVSPANTHGGGGPYAEFRCNTHVFAPVRTNVTSLLSANLPVTILYPYQKANRAMPKRLPRKRKKNGTPTPSRLPDLHLTESLLDKFGGGPQVNAVDAAQDIMYDAWDAGDRRRRIALAKKALELSPLCADAYVLLAQETAKDLDQAIEIYRQGVEAGEKALGKTAFREDVGHFWGLLETRPYMRARHGLAQTLWDKGFRDEAVTHYRDMLRLNPNDNQGIRYLLLDCLLILGRDDDAARLIKRYKEDGSAAWSWSRALLAFRQSGDCPGSRSALSQAIGDNTHVAALLLGDKKMPRQLPAYIGLGDKNEAVAYVHGAAMAWAATPGALTWVRACQPR